MNIRLSLAQINSCVGDIAGNTNNIVHYIEQAKANDADIICFPEMAITGYPPEDLLLKKSFIKDNINSLKEIKNASASLIVVVGFVDFKSCAYNAAAIIQNNEIKGIYRKTRLPNYGVFDEERYFQPGKEITVFKAGDITFGVNICEDIWYSGNPTKKQVTKGDAGFIINLSSSPYHAEKPVIRENMLRERAKQYSCVIGFCNMVGGQDELVFDGTSSVISKSGEVISRAKSFEEKLLITDLDSRELVMPYKKKKGRPEVKTIKLEPIKKKDKRRIKSSKSRFYNEENEILRALITGTRDYVRKNGFKKVVIGLSGGIDSALVAAIAREALGSQNVVGILMPSEISSKGSVKDSKLLSRNLNIKNITVPIQDIFNSYLDGLSELFKNTVPNEAEENLQARIRGNILMALSNKFGHLVLTTGNKSEMSVGYATLYGDMAGGFAVIKDIPKTLVYKLAKSYNKSSKKDIIPKTILTKEPSAELRPDQKDTDSLPPYEELDRILKLYIEDDLGIKEIVKSGENKDLTEKIVKMVDKNEYKRRQSPPGIKITNKAFGKDRRMPITSRYK